ncbi:MAG: hypothetical protein H6Q69_922 [Firmicutes bacterium]|nr:hypothetical protein [Bacillota bacterium]
MNKNQDSGPALVVYPTDKLAETATENRLSPAIIDHVIEILNQAVKADSDAIARLIICRVPCNETLANHPTIQVGAIINKTSACGKSEEGLNIQRYEVGLLGIINGLFGVDENDYGFIAAQFEDGELIGFIKTPPLRTKGRHRTVD